MFTSAVCVWGGGGGGGYDGNTRVRSCICVRFVCHTCMPLQSDESEMTEEEMAAVDAEAAEVQKELTGLEAECRTKEATLSGLTSALTTEEAEKQLAIVSKEVRITTLPHA